MALDWIENHPGVKLAQTRLRAHARTQSQDSLLATLRDLQAMKIDLIAALEDTAHNNPARLSTERIGALRDLEIAIAYLCITDPTSKTALARLNNARLGLTNDGAPDHSRRFEQMREPIPGRSPL